MKRIETYERAIEEKATSLEARGINAAAFWAYRKSQEAGNEMIDFSECIWDNDIEGICKDFRENGIDEFTISSTFSGLIATLELFEANGFKMSGLTKVNANYTDFMTNTRARIPAIRMTRA